MGIAPSESMKEAKLQLQRALENINDTWIQENPLKLEFWGAHWLPGDVDVNHEIVKTLSTSYEEVLGSKPIIEASPWGTDGFKI
jgi:acetylornithine deacetylase